MILNMVKNEREAQNIFNKIKKVADANIGDDFKIEFIGKINNDSKVASSIKQRELFAKLYPTSVASSDIANISKMIANKVERNMLVLPEQSGLSGFFKRLMGHF